MLADMQDFYSAIDEMFHMRRFPHSSLIPVSEAVRLTPSVCPTVWWQICQIECFYLIALAPLKTSVINLLHSFYARFTVKKKKRFLIKTLLSHASELLIQPANRFFFLNLWHTLCNSCLKGAICKVFLTHTCKELLVLSLWDKRYCSDSQ